MKITGLFLCFLCVYAFALISKADGVRLQIRATEVPPGLTPDVEGAGNESTATAGVEGSKS